MPPSGLYFIAIALLVAVYLARADSKSNRPHHDADAISDFFGGHPGGHDNSNRVHDFTASFIDRVTCPKQMRTPFEFWRVGFIRLYRGRGKMWKFVRELKPIGIHLQTPEARFKDADIDHFITNWFDLKKPTLICTAGFVQEMSHPFYKRLLAQYDTLQESRNGISPINMIFFDWTRYFNRAFGLFSQFDKTVAYGDHIGRLLAYFIKRLAVKYNYKLSEVHIVTHSLSTHIAGSTGRKLVADGMGQIGQITAIDPTGVCFHNSSWHMGEHYGLKGTDAKLVLATHYNMQLLGARHPIGGVDIFVNGGKDQPAVDEKLVEDYTIRERTMILLGVSDHALAIRHDLSRVIPTDCHDVAYECESFEKFRRGQCASCGEQGQSCAMIGTMVAAAMNLQQHEKNYNLNTQMHITTGRSSFCLHHYQVVAKLKEGASKDVLKNFTDGLVAYEIDYDLTIRPRHATNGSDEPEFTELIRLNTNDLRFRRHLREQSLEVFNAIESISINYMSNMSEDKRKEKSIKYCPDDSTKNPLRLTYCEESQSE